MRHEKSQRRPKGYVRALMIVLFSTMALFVLMGAQPPGDEKGEFESYPAPAKSPAQPPAPKSGSEQAPAIQPIQPPGVEQTPAIQPIQPPGVEQTPAIQPVQPPCVEKAPAQYEMIILRKVCRFSSDYKKVETKLNEYGLEGYKIVGMVMDRTGAMIWSLQRTKRS